MIGAMAARTKIPIGRGQDTRAKATYSNTERPAR
ncbi:hypothetical protein IW248_003300 [Micromonospora ureilytica]|uniref:Uncharacterized protein n=1 Tax=Micromonospora ureilytica TaxID=709868 RepID=A0ABS0JL16_9ACTN|nr:hypothetical protein [Micromonospora ureilytica]